MDNENFKLIKQKLSEIAEKFNIKIERLFFNNANDDVYCITLIRGEKKGTINIPQEWIDDYLRNNNLYRRSQIEQIFREFALFGTKD